MYKYSDINPDRKTTDSALADLFHTIILFIREHTDAGVLFIGVSTYALRIANEIRKKPASIDQVMDRRSAPFAVDWIV